MLSPGWGPAGHSILRGVRITSARSATACRRFVIRLACWRSGTRLCKRRIDLDGRIEICGCFCAEPEVHINITPHHECIRVSGFKQNGLVAIGQGAVQILFQFQPCSTTTTQSDSICRLGEHRPVIVGQRHVISPRVHFQCGVIYQSGDVIGKMLERRCVIFKSLVCFTCLAVSLAEQRIEKTFHLRVGQIGSDQHRAELDSCLGRKRVVLAIGERRTQPNCRTHVGRCAPERQE